MQKIITTDDILNDRSLISEERAKKIEENAQAEAMKILHGGKNLNSLRDRPEKLNDASDFTDAEIFFCEGEQHCPYNVCH